MSPSDPTEVVITGGVAGERADKAIATLAGLSRSAVRALIDRGAITVGGVPVRPSDRLAAGTLVSAILDVPPETIAAAPVDFGVALVDQEVIVVDKPAGLVVHPGAGHPTDTLLNGLLDRYAGQRDLGEERRFGLLHRLDRVTSGLLLVARTADVYEHLKARLAARDIIRRYLTLVLGHAPAATGTIEAAIARDPSQPTRNMVRVGGRPAVTHYRRLATWDDVTLLSVTLETGRTHQIRVHLQSIDLPVAGDRVYGRVDQRFDRGRTFLHATELGFETPHGGERLIRSPLPADLAAVLTRLGEPATGAVPAD